MKKILGILMLIMFTASCNDEGNDTLPATKIELGEGTPLSQVLYADDTEAAEINFKAPSSWRIDVAETSTRSLENSTDWLCIGQYAGSPGKFTVAVTLRKNTTGADRSADIIITSLQDTVRMSLEQRATTKDGTPVPHVDRKAYVRSVVKYASCDNESDTAVFMTFGYDGMGRVTEMKSHTYAMAEVPGHTYNFSFAYGSDRVSYDRADTYGGRTFMSGGFYMLDKQGRAISSVHKNRAGDDSGDERNYTYEYNSEDFIDRAIAYGVSGSEHFIPVWEYGNLVKMNYRNIRPPVREEEVEIRYAVIENDVVVDLVQLVCFGSEGNRALSRIHGPGHTGCSLLDIFGRRVENMPAEIKVMENDGTSQTISFDYKLDTNNRIVEIKATVTSSAGKTRISRYVVEYM